MENAKLLVKDIKDNLDKKTASRKDERSVMKAMLNDPNFKVGIYSKAGKGEDYSPYEDTRKTFANIIAATTKMPVSEARELANGYEVTKSDADTFVNVSKEFINTYMETGRKLPLGGRKRSNVTLIKKEVPKRKTRVPNQDKSVTIPAHDSIKVYGSCPSWMK